MIAEMVAQVLVILVFLFLPGFLWAKCLFKNAWMREQLALAPGISLAIIVPVAFIIWGPLGLPVDEWGSLAIFIVSLIPALLILVVTNRSQINSMLSNIGSGTYIKEFYDRIRREGRREHLILMLVIIFAALLNFQPHFNYAHPLHTDEWHYIIRTRDVGVSRSYLDWARSYPETGYLTLLALLHSSSKVPLLDLTLLLPTLILSYALVLFFVLGKRYGPGYVVIFPVLLVPTSVRYLGPALMVPVALFMVTLPLALLIIHNEGLRALPLVPFLMVCQALLHPPSAIALFVILMVSSIFIFKKSRKKGVTLLVVLGILGALAFLPLELWINNLKWNRITEQGGFFLDPPSFTGYVDVMGIMLIFLAALGAVAIIKKRETRSIAALISSGIMIVIIITFVFVLPEFSNVTALHDRILLCLIIVLIIPAGYGIAAIRKIDSRLGFATVAVLLIISTGIHIQTDYYHMISEQEYDDFVWISKNLNESYGKAILDPWKAVPFRAVTQKKVYHSWPQGPNSEHEAKVKRINEFFDNECQNTSFLVANGISIVYTSGPCSNIDLVRVHERVYILSQ
jgi:hypothetical protein